MSEPVWVSVDLGTSATKVGLVDSTGTVLARASVPVGGGGGPTGTNRQDAATFVGGAVSLISNVLRASNIDPSRVGAIALDGQMGSVVGVDASGEATTPWLTNVDEGVSAWRGRLLPDHGQAIRRATGGSPYMLPGILSIREQDPAAYRRTARFTVLASFVASRLVGSRAGTLSLDTSHLVFSGLADAAAGQWAPDLIDLFDIDAGRLPDVVSPVTVVGGLCPEMASATGLRSGVPVLAGVGDQVAGYLGSGLIDGSVAVDVAGSSTCFAVSTEHFLTADDGLYDMVRSPIEGRWIPMYTVLGGGLSHRWLANLLEGSPDTDAIRSFEAWEARIAEQPSRRPILFLPHLAGRGCPPLPEHRGLAMGFGWQSTAEDMYLGLLEGIAFSNLHFLQHAVRQFPDVVPTEVRTIGGGSLSRVWNQLRADVMGIGYRQLRTADAALVGDAVLASVATGQHSTVSDAVTAMVQLAASVEPDLDRHAVYRDYARLHARLENQLAGVFQEYAALRPIPPTRERPAPPSG